MGKSKKRSRDRESSKKRSRDRDSSSELRRKIRKLQDQLSARRTETRDESSEITNETGNNTGMYIRVALIFKV